MNKTKFTGMTVTGTLTKFETLEEAKKYYSGYPKGTYTIRETV